MTNKPLDHSDLVQQGSLSEGDVSPCTNYFRSAAFDIENISNFFTEQATLRRRSLALSPTLQSMLHVMILFGLGVLFFKTKHSLMSDTA